MTGFLKRDCYLIRGNLKAYAAFMVLFAGVAIFTDVNTTMLSVYIVVFGMSSIMGLFNYDEFNHWMAYGAAVPSGRRAMVDARYLLCVLLAVGIAAVQAVIGLLAREGDVLLLSSAYSGAFLLYAAITLPVCYRFGGTKARTVMIVVIAGIAAVFGMLGATMSISAGHTSLRLPPILLMIPLVGIAALAVSWRISTGIMEGKEL